LSAGDIILPLKKTDTCRIAFCAVNEYAFALALMDGFSEMQSLDPELTRSG
jgi:hypothetical protein